MDPDQLALRDRLTIVSIAVGLIRLFVQLFVGRKPRPSEPSGGLLLWFKDDQNTLLVFQKYRGAPVGAIAEKQIVTAESDRSHL